MQPASSVPRSFGGEALNYTGCMFVNAFLSVCKYICVHAKLKNLGFEPPSLPGLTQCNLHWLLTIAHKLGRRKTACATLYSSATKRRPVCIGQQNLGVDSHTSMWRRKAATPLFWSLQSCLTHGSLNYEVVSKAKKPHTLLILKRWS